MADASYQQLYTPIVPFRILPVTAPIIYNIIMIHSNKNILIKPQTIETINKEITSTHWKTLNIKP